MGRDDSAWAERPCSRKWTLDDRPCPFFACGRNCQRTWAQEAGPLYALTRAVVMVLLVVVESYLTHLLYTARRERVDEKRLKHWNALEHLTFWLWTATLLQLPSTTALEGSKGSPRSRSKP